MEPGKISSPAQQNLRMNFHAFWRPELKAMGDLLANRIVAAVWVPAPPAIRYRQAVDAVRAAGAANVAIRSATASPPSEG